MKKSLWYRTLDWYFGRFGVPGYIALQISVQVLIWSIFMLFAVQFNDKP